MSLVTNENDLGGLEDGETVGAEPNIGYWVSPMGSFHDYTHIEMALRAICTTEAIYNKGIALLEEMSKLLVTDGNFVKHPVPPATSMFYRIASTRTHNTPPKYRIVMAATRMKPPGIAKLELKINQGMMVADFGALMAIKY